MLAALLEALDGELGAAVELRRRLHEHPELAHAERWTSETISAALGPLACEPVAGTGLLVAVGPPGRPVAIRAELDGLPVREATGASFSARGETMHACGHDVHMAALVALSRAAARLEGDLPVPLLAIFQPSEEAYPSGAKSIAARIDPLAVVAAHVHPELPWGTVAIDPGAVNASCDAIEIVVHGEATHGAYPHLGLDPILALSETVVSLHAAVGRRIDPLHPATLTIGVIEGGSAENVIPASARARGALRAHSEEDRARLRELAGEVVAGVAAAHGCRGELRLTAGEPVLHNDEAIAARAKELLRETGLAAAPEPWRSCGSDDFSFYGEGRRPIAMAFVGLEGAPGFNSRPLHHPELLPPEEAVAAVARTQAAMYAAAAQTSSAQAQEDAGR